MATVICIVAVNDARIVYSLKKHVLGETLGRHIGRIGMTAPTSGWNLDEISPEARRAAEKAAATAGMPLDEWLNQFIKYMSTMELRGHDQDASSEILKKAALDVKADGNNAVVPVAEDELLLGDIVDEPPASLAPDTLLPNRFEDEPPPEREIESAIEAWRKTGSLPPVRVRRDPKRPGSYEIVTGVERWEAARRLKMKLLPVAVEALNDDELLRATLINRVMRRSLAPLDESQVYRRMISEAGMSVADIAKAIGRSTDHVDGILRLLGLPRSVQTMLEQGQLTLLHARTLLDADDPDAAAREVVARRLDIYQTEQLVKTHNTRKAAESATGNLPPPATPTHDHRSPDGGAGGATIEDEPDERLIERHLTRLLGLDVAIAEQQDSGLVSIRYDSRDQLSRLLARLNRLPPT